MPDEVVNFRMGFPSNYCHNLLNELTYKSSFLRHYREDVLIYAPQFFIDVLKYEMSKFHYRQAEDNDIVLFNGFKIVVGYESKLIAAHPNYPLYRSPEMYAEVEILNWTK